MENQIEIQTPDGAFSAYVAFPKTLPAPVVVVLQEIFGVNPDIRQSADELAEQGYIALSPDLFWRAVRNIELSDKTDWKQGLDLYHSYDLDKGVLDIMAVIQEAKRMPNSTGKVGVTGFCLGGLMTFLTCARDSNQLINCGVAYYGGNTDKHLSESSGIHTPLMMHFGEEDEFISKEAQALIKAAVKGNDDIEVHSYPGRAHAFARHRGEKYDATAARLANERTAAFLKLHLM